MSNDTLLTVVGNLVADPELRFTPTGRAVATVRLASTARYQDRATGEWRDSSTLFLDCVIWGLQAENTAECLLRGHEVIVRGRLKQHSYETGEGDRRTVIELEAEYIGPSLRNATAKIAKVKRFNPVRGPVPEPANGPSVTQVSSPVADVWSGTTVPAGVAGTSNGPPF
jgi:single-strand DNA-binding protein